jgi:ADP-dependent NAD(P)H-hydrate dehydratase
VIALRENRDGTISPDAVGGFARDIGRADAVLVGTSTLDADATGDLVAAVVPHLGDEAVLVVDAGAIPVLEHRPELLAPVAARTAVIPNPVEMAKLLGVPERWVQDNPDAALDQAVARLGTVVALRDATTRTTAPCAPRFVDAAGHHALGTSGSGDVLAGALLGLAARGTDPLRATLWAVHVHGLAGERLGIEGAGIGTLAREILTELPAVVRSIERSR